MTKEEDEAPDWVGAQEFYAKYETKEVLGRYAHRRIQTNKWFPRSSPRSVKRAGPVCLIVIHHRRRNGGALLLHNLHIVGGRKRAITPVSGGQRPLVGQQPVSFSLRLGVWVTRSPDGNKMFSRSRALHSSLRERNNQADGEAV